MTTPPEVLFVIFAAGVADMATGTLRMILSVAGLRWQASLTGAVQITFFAFAVTGVVTNLSDPAAVFVYAMGYAVGVWIGMWIDERIALGYRVVHIINRDPDVSVASHLWARGMRCTRMEGQGRDGVVEFAMAVTPRRGAERVRRLVEEVAPHAFISVERVERSSGGQVTGDLLLARDNWLGRVIRR